MESSFSRIGMWVVSTHLNRGVLCGQHREGRSPDGGPVIYFLIVLEFRQGVACHPKAATSEVIFGNHRLVYRSGNVCRIVQHDD